MRVSCAIGLLIAFLVSPAWIWAAQQEGWPDSRVKSLAWQRDAMEPLQVQSTIDKLNEEAKTRFGERFIVKYYLDLGPLNRVQINADLWNALSIRQRQELGENFAKVFWGTGLLFCQFFVEDSLVGKVRSDPMRGGLKYEAVR